LIIKREVVDRCTRNREEELFRKVEEFGSCVLREDFQSHVLSVN
jgi:hypothetical protein